MDWRPLALVALGVFVAVSGCSGLLADGGAEDGTLTPAPVPTATPMSESPGRSLPPGVSSRGISDLDELVRAHGDALEHRSYVWREWRGTHRVGARVSERPLRITTVEVANETRYRFWADSHVIELGQRTRFVYNYSEFVTGGVAYTRLSGLGVNSSDLKRLPAPGASQRVRGQTATALYRYLSLAPENVTVTAVGDTDEARYRIEGRGGDLLYVDPVRNYSVTAVVTADGLVTSLRVRYRTIRFGEPDVVRYQFAFSGLDETTVAAPEWYERNDRDP